MAVDRDAAVYSIGIVQKLTGLSARQIRYYDQQGLVRPKRTHGNRRLYSPADVDRLLKIKELLSQGMNLAGIREWLAQRGDLDPAEAANPPPKGGRATPAPSASAARSREKPSTHPPPQAGSASPTTPGERRFDDTRLVHTLMQYPDLTSLYPVDHQAALLHLLQSSSPRKDESARE